MKRIFPIFVIVLMLAGCETLSQQIARILTSGVPSNTTPSDPENGSAGVTVTFFGVGHFVPWGQNVPFLTYK